MGSFFQQYGVEEERRGRVIKAIVLSCLGIAVLAIVGYFVLHNYSEKQVVNRFLQQINAHNYQEAYREWGCTAAHPCPNYSYNRFLDDWGPQKKAGSPWKIASTDGCQAFLTVNVQAEGAELQSLSVQRSDKSLGFAPYPECQERKWHWKQFFQRVFGGDSRKS
ncbi:MAG: hypothetical protein JOY85_19660 [Acidobacteriaceae bacterium]|nr:hypothetical protein [Acidobacteriaceae bacterium]